MFSNKLYKQLDVGWTFSLLALVALAVGPVPWFAYRFGKVWRSREKVDWDDTRREDLDGHNEVGVGKAADAWSEVTQV